MSILSSFEFCIRRIFSAICLLDSQLKRVNTSCFHINLDQDKHFIFTPRSSHRNKEYAIRVESI